MERYGSHNVFSKGYKTAKVFCDSVYGDHSETGRKLTVMRSLLNKIQDFLRQRSVRYRPSCTSISKCSKCVEEESVPADWSVIARARAVRRLLFEKVGRVVDGDSGIFQGSE